MRSLLHLDVDLETLWQGAEEAYAERKTWIASQQSISTRLRRKKGKNDEGKRD
jgi:hypothetical protein